MKKTLIKLATLATVTLPGFILAQGTGTGSGGFNNLQTNIITPIGKIINALIPIVFALGILAFFWGLVKYIFSQGSEEGKADGKKIMLWALVAIFVMASVFGIINLAQRTLGVDQNNQVTPPVIRLPDVIPGRTQ